MSEKDKKKKDTKKEKHVHEELEGFDVKISPFGQIESNFDVDKINKFLNERVDDKKLRDRDDLDDDEQE
jgi:hypothetical protein